MQNSGAPSRQFFAANSNCNGATAQVTPFYMGNDTVPMESQGYVRNNNWGMQVSLSIPLDGSMVELCKSIARKHEQKIRLDYELVRALKCTEIMKAGFTFRPGSRVEILCHDIVPIVSLTNDRSSSQHIVSGDSGGAALNNRLHNRINSVHERISALDRRLDNIELTVASDYVKKKELSELLSRMEDHMVRIENKLDQIVLKYG